VSGQSVPGLVIDIDSDEDSPHGVVGSCHPASLARPTD
jgi:hypothetical protein